jgi:hypothetical protein
MGLESVWDTRDMSRTDDEMSLHENGTGTRAPIYIRGPSVPFLPNMKPMILPAFQQPHLRLEVIPQPLTALTPSYHRPGLIMTEEPYGPRTTTPASHW